MKIILTEKQEEIIKREMLKEAVGFGFSIEYMKQLGSLKARYQYCKQFLGNPIGRGSSRVVFQYDDQWVIKLALNGKGIAQNEAECDFSKEWFVNITPNVNYEMTDEEGYKFLMSEYIIPAKDEDFVEVFGFDFNTWKKFINTCVCQYDRRYEKKISRYNDSHKFNSDELSEIIENNDIAREFYDYLTNYQPFHYDMMNIKNYGLTNRNGYSEIVLCDSGLNEEIWNNHYARESKENNKPLLDESIKIHKGEKGKNKSTQARWQDSIDCPHCGESKAFFSMSISDGNKGRGRIKVMDENGQEIDSEVQTIALYYCPKCYKFTALNNMA